MLNFSPKVLNKRPPGSTQKCIPSLRHKKEVYGEGLLVFPRPQRFFSSPQTEGSGERERAWGEEVSSVRSALFSSAAGRVLRSRAREKKNSALRPSTYVLRSGRSTVSTRPPHGAYRRGFFFTATEKSF